MEIVALSLLTVGSLRWSREDGSQALTVVAKSTFELAPVVSKLSPEQLPVFTRDRHHDGDPARSLYAASDLAPLKRQPEVTLVGHAHAPEGRLVHSFVARLVVGDVDKSVEVFGARTVTASGEVRLGTRFAKMPLRYERTVGGPDTDNPVGARSDTRDRYGLLALANLQPPGLHLEDASSATPIGFGPLASSWPGRARRSAERADGSYWNAAPVDQRLGELRGDERIVLENLHPRHRRLVTNLSGPRPQAFVEAPDRQPWEMGMTCDTLWIDTDLGVCTLTWRGTLGLEGLDVERLRVLVAAPRGTAPLAFADVRALELEAERLPVSSVSSPIDLSNEPWSEGPDSDDRTEPGKQARRGDIELLGSDTLPFTRPPCGVTRLPSGATRPPSGAARPPSGVPHPTPAPSRPSRRPTDPLRGATMDLSPDWAASALPWDGQRGTPSGVPTVVAPPAYRAVAGASLLPSTAATPWAHAVGAAAPTRLSPSNAASAPVPLRRGPVAAGSPVGGPVAAGSPVGGPPLGAIADAARGGAVAASDAAAAAAAVEMRRDEAPMASGESGIVASPPAASALLELLWLDASAAPRVRALGRAEGSPLGFLGRDDVGESPDKDRIAARRALARGKAASIADLQRTLVAWLDDEAKVGAPVEVLAGDITLSFDEVRELEVIVAVAKPLGGSDKKLRELLDAAAAALAASPIPVALVAAMIPSIREQLARAPRTSQSGYVDVAVKRALLEGRHLQRRTVLGERRIRCLLEGQGEAPIPLYLPEAVATHLPMFERFAAAVAVEVRPAQDQFESCPVSLLALALARSLPRR